MKIILTLLLFLAKPSFGNYPLLKAGGGGASIEEYMTATVYAEDQFIWDGISFFQALQNYTSVDIATDIGNGNLTRMTDPIFGLDGLTSNIQGQFDGVSTRIGVTEADIATNVSDIGDNATNIASNNTAIQSNSTSIGTLQTSVSSNTSAITSNDTDIATNVTNISTNATNIASNDTDIAALTTNKADVDFGNVTGDISADFNLIPDGDQTLGADALATSWQRIYAERMFFYNESYGQRTLDLIGGNGNFGDVGEVYGAKVTNDNAVDSVRGGLGVGTKSADLAGDTTGNLILFTGASNVDSTGYIKIATGSAGGGQPRGDIKLDGQNIDMTSRPIINVRDPETDNEAANKVYVDRRSGGEGVGNNAFDADDNPRGEDGSSAYLATGGTLSNDTTDPLEGESSIVFTAISNGDFVRSSQATVDKAVFRGTACEATINYVTENTQLEMLITDGAENVLLTEVLPQRSTFGSHTIYFLCPTAAVIAADADQAERFIRIRQGGALGGPYEPIKFDKLYLGTNRTLSELDLPDTFAAKIDGTVATPTVLSSSADFLSGTCVKPFAARYTCDFTTGLLSQAPSCQATFEGPADMGSTGFVGSCSVTTTSTDVQVDCLRKGDTGSVRTDVVVNLECTKQGEDAQQTVQVIKNIPTIAENLSSNFSFKRSATNVLTEVSPAGWITSCTGTSTITCQVDPDLAVEPLVCTGARSNGMGYVAQNSSSTNTQIVLNLAQSNGAAANVPISATCHKQGVDLALPQIQPIIVGQVRSSHAEGVSSNIFKDVCYVEFVSGTPIPSNELCNSWISSISDPGGFGQSTINFSENFKSPPVCICSSSDPSNSLVCTASNALVGSVDVKTRTSGSETFTDAEYSISCTGVK